MALSIVFSLLGLGVLLTLLFTLAVHAVPFFIAVTIGMWAYDTGAGVIGAGLVGFVAGAVALVAAQLLFAAVKSVPIRIVLALCFAAPAAVAGYYAVLGTAGLMMPSETWQMVFATVGGIAVGAVAVAVARLALFTYLPMPPTRNADADANPAANTYDRDDQQLAAPTSLPRLPAP